MYNCEQLTKFEQLCKTITISATKSAYWSLEIHLPSHRRLLAKSYKLIQLLIAKRKETFSTKEDTTKKLIQTTTVLRKRVITTLKRSPEPALALSAIFEAIGYSGLAGIGWGILAGIVVSAAVELGYEIRQIGGRYFIFKSKSKGEVK